MLNIGKLVRDQADYYLGAVARRQAVRARLGRGWPTGSAGRMSGRSPRRLGIWSATPRSSAVGTLYQAVLRAELTSWLGVE